MTISEYEESLMLRYGVDATSIMSLKELADDLPASNIQPHIAGLTSVEAVVLTSRLLQELANNLGILFNHEDVIGIANLPVVEPAKKQSAGESEKAEQY